MRPFGFALVVVCCSALQGQAAGIRALQVPADAAGPAIAGAVWTPCSAPVGEVALGHLSVAGVRDCPLAGDKLPLVVISHGRAGWFGGHHDTAAALADAGFVVVAINHPGDNGLDGKRMNELSVAVERPTDIRRLIDFMLGAWPDAARIDRERIGIYGFSRGGYAGLVAAGGNPNFRRVATRCAERTGSNGCEFLPKDGSIPEPGPLRDRRIKAVVIADPGFGFLFGPDDLKAVDVPVQLWSSTHGGAGVTLEGNLQLKNKLPPEPDYRVVPDAGHWAFLAPCPPGQINPRICVDAPGFDRIAFHRQFNAEVLAFFSKHFPKTGSSPIGNQ